MGNVSIAIQAHPARRPWVEALVTELGPEVRVAWAEPPYATATDWRPIWRTKRAALIAGLDRDAPFHCVLQDDAVLAPDFVARLERLVDAGPFLYMLFFRKKRAYPAINKLADLMLGDGGFVTTSGPILGPGLVFPRATIAPIVAFGDADPGLDGDDDRIRRWVRATGHPVYVPLPSLVDHREGRSLIGHPDGRQAWRFAA